MGLRRALIPSIIIEVAVWSTVPHVPLVWIYPLAFLAGCSPCRSSPWCAPRWA
ncbi:hypothetical protein [Arthrobacter sp. JCM 19049]|uniref:hypothetical protein n=1 Tax=Arthrobacter sp. JCM 19049 TaxID=1460643 RepID=UPI0024365677|nr:hypothetical protein [Arthrobacter sp. JCM 19049]